MSKVTDFSCMVTYFGSQNYVFSKRGTFFQQKRGAMFCLQNV